MTYAQTNYPQIQGINGRYTIHDIGCFLTSFCNLLARFGHPIDPLSLNNIFRDRGIYVDVDDGIRDDLGWSSITQYASEVVVAGTGGAVTPPTADAIVKFIYQSKSKPWLDTARTKPNIVTHFSLVNHISNGMVYILDSWDGLVKPASNYGGIKAYATYKLNQPASQPKGANEMVTDLAMVQQMAQVIGGRLGFGGHPNAFDPGQKDLPAHVGRDAGKEFSNWYFSDEAKAFRDKWLPELVRKAEAYDKLMADKSVLTPQPDPDGEEYRKLKQSLKRILA